MKGYTAKEQKIKALNRASLAEILNFQKFYGCVRISV
jgi:hypothetical protein